MVPAASGDVSVTTVPPFVLWSMDDTATAASVGKSGHTELRVASAAETGKTHVVFSSSTVAQSSQTIVRARATVLRTTFSGCW